MELKDLYPFITLLILIGMLLGVGILTFDKLGDAVKQPAHILNETITLVSGNAVAANDDITAITRIQNSTLVHTDLTDYMNFTAATGAIMFNNDNFTDQEYNMSYNYSSDSQATTVMADMTTATAAISSTWLPLLVTILILAIILTLVIRSFAQRR